VEKKSVLDTVMYTAVLVIEGFVAVLLVGLAGWGAVSLVASIWTLVSGGVAFHLANYVAVLDVALMIFIIVELFRIALAYLKHEDVIPTVLEAGLVAVARKLVTFDTHLGGAEVLMKAAGLALLLLSVAVTWYLLAKRNPRLLSQEGSTEV
jgi:uncharacterized membrane protein (DUF373 family)